MGKTYNNFLKSDWWKYLRDKKLKKHKSCYVCGNKKFLQIHHYHYRYKYNGSAKKAIEDTHVLCSSCHKEFHRIYGVKKDMTKEMKAFKRNTQKDISLMKAMYKELKDKEDWISSI